MKYLKGILLPALLALASLTAAKKDAPLVEENVFPTELVNLFYFDDSEVVLVAEFDTGQVRRSTNAGKDWKKADISTIGIVKNPFDNQVAIALGEQEHHITYDQGETWRKFKTEWMPSPNPVGWHSKDPKKIIFNTAEDCFGLPCIGESLYTTDGFKSEPKLLREDRKLCMWAKSSERFLMDDKDHDDRILCIVLGKFSPRVKDLRLLITDNYFEDEFEPSMSSGRTVSGMINMASVKGYIVAAAKSDHSSELGLYVTDDTKTWHRAEFGDGKIEENAYTILESTNYSIQVDVMRSKDVPVGSLYSSNSNGTYFTKNVEDTNRSPDGYVDFEKIANIQGIFLVNQVQNADSITGISSKKKLKSKITFDDGRTLESLRVKGDKKKELHLHSVTDIHNSGRVFSSPAPGIVMGVGNTGEYLGKYEDGDLWVSDDAGITWELALQEAHKYEFGDQGSVLVAVYDEGDTDKVMYSLEHGRPDTWKEVKLESKIQARELTTVPDSTSLKFILYGSRRKDGGGREYVMIHLDFDGLHERDCKDDDFTKWSARTDEDGKDTCVMGHKQFFQRRKWDAKCFVRADFREPLPEFEPCECDESRDYECDFNFKPSGKGKDKECKPSGSLELPKGACKEGDKTYKGSSGWRKIPGNQCKGTTKKDEEIERPCGEATTPPADNKIHTEITKFKGEKFREYYYLELDSKLDEDKKKEETVVMLTSEHEAYISHNHGKDWKKAIDDDIVAIYPHQYNNDYVYFLTATDKVYYSKNRGKNGNIKSFDAPRMPNLKHLQIMQFHPDTDKSDWIIWLGGEHCKNPMDRECHTVASVSQNNGQDWKNMLPYVKKCAFVWREAGLVKSEKLVYCEQYTDEDTSAPLQLLASDDWFSDKDAKFKSVIEFALMSEYIIVATKGEDGKSLKLDVSLDGTNFADAQFPPKLSVDHQTAYTVLDSSTHAVFLHVTVNPREDQEYGALIKSNSNGTSYVMVHKHVNRNTPGYVDFEKMQGIEGVAVINIVANADKVDQGAKKEKKTLITHNDGADWDELQAPAKDSDGKKWDCDPKNKKKCSLHLHGYTERGDPRETYSSPTAVGVMLGVGNVGESLTTFGEASTFITTDAGISWKEVKKGNYAWEFGDQGSVIVLVKRGEDTKNLYYTIDNGEKWQQYTFADHAIRVDAITTVPSDTSLNFLLWGKSGKELVAVNVDFSELDDFQKQCKLDEEDPLKGDYDFWTPEHPMLPDDQQKCLFGHEAQYHRKKRDAKCYNGQNIRHLHEIARNCTCTRRDFECDYNFERKQDGTCSLVSGLKPADPSEVCKNKDVREYWSVTGYRKIPISTCQGGKEMDLTGHPEPCPGYEEEFQKKHGISGFGIFMAVVIPFMAAGGIGYYVWRNWDGKFGRIRLGEGNNFSNDSPWISWPVAAISGLVAVIAAVPLLVGSLWRMASSRFGGGSGYGGTRFTSRSSFARDRGRYAVVDEDEGELLGDESDEDV